MAKTSEPLDKIQTHIGTLSERSLHAALKAWYAAPGDRLEYEVGGYVIDIVRDEGLFEIQTGNFSAIRRKLATLLPDYPVRLIYPIAAERWIVRQTADGEQVRRRKSPKRGSVYELFRELVRLPALINDPHFSIETLLVQEEQIWRDDGQGSWRRKGWSLADRRLLGVTGQHVFQNGRDLLALLPDDLSEPFGTSDVAKAIRQPRPVAQKMVYCLREMGALEIVGKQGNALLYRAIAHQL